jgi:hypothetical protein
MRGTYVVLTRLIALGVVLQASFIALAWFLVIDDADNGKPFVGEDSLNIGHNLHSAGGMIIPLLTLVLFVVSFFARSIPGAVKWAGFVFLAGLAQFLLGAFAFEVPELGALHGINAFVLAGVAGYAGRRATQLSSEPVAAPGAPATV